MNEYGTGILIDEVQLQKADPPAEVIDSFRDVQRAQADRERAQNEAEAFANDIIPRARGEAERLLQEAQAYRQEATARATGEAERFKSILAEYLKAEDVTVAPPLSRDHGAGAQGREQGDHRRQAGRQRRGALSAAARARAPGPRAARRRPRRSSTACREQRNEPAPAWRLRRRRRRSSCCSCCSTRCSRCTRPSRRWCCSSATRSASCRTRACTLKVPFIQQVDYFEKRVLDFDAPSVELVLGDQKRLVVDAFARYRITDALRFRQSVGTEAAFRGRLEPIVFSSLRSVLGEAPLFTILSQDRTQLMNRIKGEANKSLAGFGVELVDVRIKRADLPPENSQAVFRRMQTEREREAKELRAQGAEVGQRIRARADRERRVLIAEAQRESEILRGQGDAEAIRIFAEGVRAEPGVLRLLPLAAGLSRGAGRRLHQLRALAGQRVLPVLQRPGGERAAGSPRRSRAPTSPQAARLPAPAAGRDPDSAIRRGGVRAMARSRHGAGARPGGRGCALGAVSRADEAGGGPGRA